MVTREERESKQDSRGGDFMKEQVTEVKGRVWCLEDVRW